MKLRQISFKFVSLIMVLAILFSVSATTISAATQISEHNHEEEKKEIIDLSNLTGNEIPDNESIDKFSIQMGFVAFAYAIAFGIMCLLAVISDFTNSIAWGFNFIWAVIGATLIKLVVKILRKTNIQKKRRKVVRKGLLFYGTLIR